MILLIHSLTGGFIKLVGKKFFIITRPILLIKKIKKFPIQEYSITCRILLIDVYTKLLLEMIILIHQKTKAYTLKKGEKFKKEFINSL